MDFEPKAADLSSLDYLVLFTRRLESAALALAAGQPLTQEQVGDAVKCLTIVALLGATDPDALLKMIKLRHGIIDGSISKL